MSDTASLGAASVTVDFPICNTGMRSLKSQFIYHGTGGRVGRDARNRLSVRALPASGRVWRQGRTASLLNVSLGIDPEATGYENIMTRGLLVGLKPEEVRERTEEIAEFTELGDYLAMLANT